MRATFIRHGQSTGNAGVPSPDLASIALTELGDAQARAVAAAWIETPALIVTSPYLRTQKTAAPTSAHFPANGSSLLGRTGHDRHWQKA